MSFEEVYLSGIVLIFFSILVAAFIHKSTKSQDLLNEEFLLMALVSMVFALGWFLVVPIAILVGLAYVVAKLLILCREKWRNK